MLNKDYCSLAYSVFRVLLDGDVVGRDRAEAGGRKVRITLATGSTSDVGISRHSLRRSRPEGS